jgi:hypothetical protein
VVDSRAMQERRHLNQGFGKALSNAMEIALIPAVFAAFGYGVDRLLGTHIVFAVILGLVGIVGTCLKLFYGYRYEMEQHEREGAWNKPTGGTP